MTEKNEFPLKRQKKNSEKTMCPIVLKKKSPIGDMNFHQRTTAVYLGKQGS